MTSKPKTILIADDDLSIRTVLTQALKREGYDVMAADNGATLYQWVLEGRGDLVITDVMMPGENGLDLIPKIHRRAPDMRVIVISAQNALTTAVSASEKGALEYLPKPFDIDDLLSVVKNALRRRPVNDQNKNQPPADKTQIAEALDKSFVVGQSRAMQDIYRTIARLRNADLTVLMTGESGTGKEVIARALHEFSRFKDGPFVAINMAAIPRELIESELFGHEKGAFTGATQKNIGRFEQANGGTLFLDEIGDMPFEAQTRLLRVLQEGEFTPVGSRRSVKTRVRVVAATHQDLKARVRDGRFREDLYYRLNVVPLHVPPLRERAEDIPALVQHFIRQTGVTKVFEPAAMAAFQSHPWPGNVRTLENTVKRLVALHAEELIDRAAATAALTGMQENSAAAGISATTDLSQMVAQVLNTDPALMSGVDIYDRIIRQVEKPLITRMLAQTGGNQIRAAELLGLNRNTLRKKIRELDIDVKKEGRA
ncbi:MAG: nitrogen regulation protein NR(I) [Bdellovibrionales bacterium]|jgi:two-component system nitrogen regulation response regulator GlnG|nr:nitrogen regulation protein NR(I) [Bdellovibrionales bacterium]